MSEAGGVDLQTVERNTRVVLAVTVTALDVALVGALAGLVAGVLTPFTTWLVAGRRNKHDRWAQLYTDRRDAYLAMLKRAYWSRDLWRDWIADIEAKTSVHAPPLGETAEERAAAMAPMGLFASPDVRDAISRFEDARRALHGALNSEEAPPATDAEALADWLRPKYEDLREAVVALRTSCHRDLPRT